MNNVNPFNINLFFSPIKV